MDWILKRLAEPESRAAIAALVGTGMGYASGQMTDGVAAAAAIASVVAFVLPAPAREAVTEALSDAEKKR